MSIKPVKDATEWQQEATPWPLWAYLIDNELMSERKKRFFAVAACRRVAEYLIDPRSFRMLESCESYAEGILDIETFLQHDGEARTVAREFGESTVLGEVRLAADAAKWLGVDDFKVGRAAEFSNELFGFQAMVRAGLLEPTLHAFDAPPFWRDPVFLAGQNAEEAVQADILRDLFANPFRGVELDLEWRTSTAVALAQTIYSDQSYELLPILADALQDAGCENAQVLDHCREPLVAHFKGCWLVDLITGRC